MADTPDRIIPARHIELRSVGFHRPIRYALLLLVGVFLVLGLVNVFGQTPETVNATNAKADMELFAPSHLRGGLLYEARFTIHANEKLKHAVLSLAPGWSESQQMNTIEPAPVAQTSRNGNLIFTLGPIDKSAEFVLFIQFQVNPTNVGRRDADVTLYDGNTALLSIKRKITIYP